MPYEIVDKFERTIAKYAGAKYGVAVDSCCNAIFLSLMFRKKVLGTQQFSELQIPKRTYPGVVCAALNSGYKIKFIDYKWKGIYLLAPESIFDSALRFKKGMFFHAGAYELDFTHWCLSFHYKKHIPIGRGGMILTDDKTSYEWLKRARFDGRNQLPLSKDKITMTGWNCYMTPEQAARGLMLFDLIKDKDLPDLDSTKQGYPDLSKIGAYK